MGRVDIYFCNLLKENPICLQYTGYYKFVQLFQNLPNELNNHLKMKLVITISVITHR